MAAGSVDLGSLEMEDAAAGLVLLLASRAQFLASSQDDFAPLAERLTTAALSPGSADRPAVLYNNEIRLVVRFSYEVEGCEVARDVLFQAAAQRLKNAQLWRQLRLQVVAVDCSTHGSAACLVITLSRLADVTTSSQRCGHKLRNTASPVGALAPPDGAVLHFDHICLTLRIICSPSTSTHHPIVDDEMLDVSEDLQPDGNLQTQPTSATRRIKTAPTDVARPHDRVGITPNRLRTQSFAVEQLLPNKRSSSTNALSSANQDPDVETAVLALFDAGLLLAISSNQRQLGQAIRVVERSSFKPLASIMPEIWSPGYSSAVSTRSPFLPTISHALSHVSIGHARNPTLETKMNELCRRESNQLRSPSEQRYPESQSIIASRLLQVAQRYLFDPKAAKMLRTRDETCPHLANEPCEDLDDFSDTDSTFGNDMISDNVDYSSDYDEYDADFIDPDDLRETEAHVGDVTGEHEPVEHWEQSLDEGIQDDILSVCDSVDSLMPLEEFDELIEGAVARCLTAGDAIAHRPERPETDEMLDVY